MDAASLNRGLLATLAPVVALTLLAAGQVPAVGTGAPVVSLDPSPLRLVAAEAATGAPGRQSLHGLDLRIEAPGDPVEIWSSRASYAEPVTSTWRSPGGDVALPGSATPGTLDRFVTLSVRRPDGDLVVRRRYAACPASPAQAPVAPDAPATSPYPRACPTHPFALGSVVGVQSGWANGLGVRPRVPLAPGRYVVTTRIARPYADAFGLTTDAAVRTTALTVRRPRAARLAAADVRPLPPSRLRIVQGRLRFDATLWNAGDRPAGAAETVADHQLLSAGRRVLASVPRRTGRLPAQSPVDLTVPGAAWLPGDDPALLPVGWGSTRRAPGFDLAGLRNGVYQLAVRVGDHTAYRVLELYGPEDQPRLRVLPVGHVQE